MLILNAKLKNKKKYIKKNIHEDNLKAYLYMECKLQNINILLEYKIKNSITKNVSRCDAIILDNQKNNIIAIIEVKGPYKTSYRHKKFDLKTRQISRYNDLNIPFFLIYKRIHVFELIEYLQKNLL